MPGPTDLAVNDDPDADPLDDYIVEKAKVANLNRIDEAFPCQAIVWSSKAFGNEYCGQPEHDPFTERCWHHDPNLGGH